jgi:uncharacterized phiE125 gp8 family phage protein
MATTWPVATDAAPGAALKLITPAAPIVSWTEQATHSRIDNASEQVLVEGYIKTATQHLDAKYGILAGGTLGVQTWELYLDAFPCGPIHIPLSPLIDVVNLTYVDTDGLPQTVDPINYVVDDKGRDGWIVPLATWPPTLAAINVVAVRFRAGHATVPAPLKTAIMLLAGHYYENREQTSPASLTVVPWAVEQLVAPYRRIVI